jgi:hypothetical protein
VHLAEAVSLDAADLRVEVLIAAFITLEGVAEAPALKIARAFCAERMHDHAPPTAKKSRR